MDNEKIIFFDGHCVMCNNFARRILRWDKKGEIKLATLQSNSAAKLLPKHLTSNPNTLVFIDGEKTYYKSDASLRSVAAIGWPYKIVLAFLIVPRSIRDFFYNILSRNRFKWFGKSEECGIQLVDKNDQILE